MLEMNSKPASCFKAVKMYLKPSGRVKSSPDGLKAVTANKCGYKSFQ